MDSIETYKIYKAERKSNKQKTQLSLTPKIKSKPQKIKTYKVPTGEKKVFENIRNTRKRVCVVCDKKILEARTRCFAHLLAKGQRPKYRLEENNIVLVCSIECHHRVDSMIVGNKKLVEEQLLSGIIPDIKGLT